MDTTTQLTRELRDEARFYRLQAGVLAAFAFTEVLPGGTGGSGQLAARLIGVGALLAAAFSVPAFEKAGGELLRVVVSLGSVLSLGALVWVQGRTNGMHAILLVAAGAASLLPRSAAATCAMVAAALHGGIVAASGVSVAVEAQWMVIEVAVVVLGLRAYSAAGVEAGSAVRLDAVRASRPLGPVLVNVAQAERRPAA